MRWLVLACALLVGCAGMQTTAMLHIEYTTPQPETVKPAPAVGKLPI